MVLPLVQLWLAFQLLPTPTCHLPHYALLPEELGADGRLAQPSRRRIVDQADRAVAGLEASNRPLVTSRALLY